MPWNDARGYDQNAAPVFPQGAAFGAGSPAETSQQPAGLSDFLGALYGAVGGMAQRAVGNSQTSLDTGNYNPAPVMEAAMPGTNIDDRRNENFSGAYHDDGSFAWDRIPQTLKSLSVNAGNALWGTPQIPEAPRSRLSDDLGREDIKLEPNVGRSLLHRAIDDVQTSANMVGVGKEPSWADKLTEERQSSLIDILKKYGLAGFAAPPIFANAGEQKT